MTDLNPDIPDKPIEIPASPVGDQAATFGRDALLVISALPALVAVLGTHDVTKIVAYLTGQALAPVLGVLTLAGTVAWRQWKARKRHSNDVKIGSAVSDAIAVVK